MKRTEGKREREKEKEKKDEERRRGSRRSRPTRSPIEFVMLTMRS